MMRVVCGGEDHPTGRWRWRVYGNWIHDHTHAYWHTHMFALHTCTHTPHTMQHSRKARLRFAA
eukprot:2538235-Rhodomonas_salina.1